MNEMEVAIWAAAFVGRWERDVALYENHGRGQARLDPTQQGHFSRAEWADCCLESYRAAMHCEDTPSLTPVKENWEALALGQDEEEG